MFGGKKDDKSKGRQGGQNPRRNHNLAQFGLMEVPNIDGLDLGGGGDDDDGDLEAELLALTGGGGGQKPRKKGKPVVSANELDRMVNECMREDYDDDISDEDDPDLLAELSALGGADDSPPPPEPVRAAPMPPSKPRAAPPASDYRNPEPVMPRHRPMAAGTNLISLLAERISMYEDAESNAKATGETSRARRFNRGLKTLRQMEKAAKAGKPINEEDIPPAVVVKMSGKGSGSSSATVSSPEDSMPPAPLPPHVRDPTLSASTILHDVAFQDHDGTPSGTPRATPPRQNSSESSSKPPAPQRQRSRSSLKRTISAGPAGVVQVRQNEYKLAALAAKKNGDKESALSYMRIAKRLEPFIAMAESGQDIDLSVLPGPPGSTPLSQPASASPPAPPPSQSAPTEIPVSNPEAPSNPGADAGNPSGPPPPSSVLEALEQRLAKYTEQRDKAKKEENSRKERMNQRIMKQYQDAIKHHKAGKPVAFDELPTPPGFPPIPVGGGQPAPAAPAPAAPTAAASGAKEGVDSSPPKQAKVAAPQPPGQGKSAPAAPNVRNAPQSRVEKQLSFLVKRQGQFKQAALEAKKRGEMEQAKEYLRMSKGFDQLIEATKGGLPVDMNTVPVPPQEQINQTNMDFEVVNAEDCVIAPPEVSGDVTITYTKLEEDLIAQIKMCAQTREHFKATGDVASSNRFEQLIVHTKKDLDAVRAAFKRGDNPPRFHYENRSFNIIQCNTDLNDSDCEVTVVRGINYNVDNPKDVDTYVKVEFPYPAENSPQDRSLLVKDTNNPEYGHKTVFSIDRKSRALARVFKRHGVKVQVIKEGGWFHRDSTLGSVKVPLVSLETKCTLHDSFDLTDERKKMVGGKLEVKIRVRNPIVTKQLEKVTEKWLVIDGF